MVCMLVKLIVLGLILSAVPFKGRLGLRESSVLSGLHPSVSNVTAVRWRRSVPIHDSIFQNGSLHFNLSPAAPVLYSFKFPGRCNAPQIRVVAHNRQLVSAFYDGEVSFALRAAAEFDANIFPLDLVDKMGIHYGKGYSRRHRESRIGQAALQFSSASG